MEGHGIVDKHAYVAGCILYPFLFFLFFFFFFFGFACIYVVTVVLLRFLLLSMLCFHVVST